MRTFTIWSEGYAATGEAGAAQQEALVMAETFQEACDKHFAGDPLYDRETLTYWGCRLFDNRQDAQRSFG